LPNNVWKTFFISARGKFLELLCDMRDGGFPVPSKSVRFSDTNKTSRILLSYYGSWQRK
jgi:hypothetical protein